MITEQQLKTILPTCKNIDVWVPLLNNYFKKYDFNTDQQSRFLAQTGHESGDFNQLRENLNYSTERLITVFPKYFRHLLDTEVVKYSRNPEKIANRVYASRMGNGVEQSGDGWKYRGRGIIQITGKNNYKNCSKWTFNDDRILEKPEMLEQPEFALLSAIWFWKSNKLDTIESYDTVTKRVNGGNHGAADRNMRLARAKTVLG
jgi:putative chitinase